VVARRFLAYRSIRSAQGRLYVDIYLRFAHNRKHSSDPSRLHFRLRARRKYSILFVVSR
jgi:hypothetical protein